MTDEKPKRKYWRRGPRRKKGAAPETGAVAPAESIVGAAEGPGPEDVPAGASAEEAAAAPEVPREILEAVEQVEAGAARKKSRRRRSRGKKGTDAAASPSESAGRPESEIPRSAEAPPPVGADVPEEAPPESAGAPPLPGPEETVGTAAEGEVSPALPEESAPPERHGRRRRRRRRRRRGGNGQAAAPEGGEAEAPEGPAPGEEEIAGAEVTDSEEFDVFPEGETKTGETGGEPSDEEFEETAAADEEGRGPKKAMLIDGAYPEEMRVSIVTEGVLDYFEVENQREKKFKGNIYKAKVVNIAPAIEAAFVDFGGGRHGFLPLNEYCGGALIDNLEHWNEGEKRPHLRSGMELLVQVTKEESTVKGAAVTSYISIAGRYLVMMLGMKRFGISKKISGEKERERIRKQMEKLDYPDHLGFIVRTVGANRPLKDLRDDLQNLLKLWDRTVAGARSSRAPALLYEEQDIVIRTLRDNYSADVAEVHINSEDSFRKAAAFFDVYYPQQKGKLKLYRQKRPLYTKYNLDEQLERLAARRVPLPSGGYLIIDRTEAFWCIDVNSGKSSKDRDIEDTAYRTNKEAAVEIARHLRLRDIGGLIVIDFIDMENRNHNRDVEKTLKEGLKRDKAKSDVSALGKFGLVAVSRQRMGISFYDVLLKECDQCHATGFTPTPDAAMVRILRRIHEDLSREPGKDLLVRVSPALLEELLNTKREDVTRLVRMCGGNVAFRADAALPPWSYAFGPAPA